MPFLRVARDKRGYETISLLHSARRQGKVRARLLYWFRTPPDVRVGRTAFDETAIRQLEQAHPDVVFDWSRLLQAGQTLAVVAAREPRREGAGGARRSARRGSARRRGNRPPALPTEPGDRKRQEPAGGEPGPEGPAGPGQTTGD